MAGAASAAAWGTAGVGDTAIGDVAEVGATVAAGCEGTEATGAAPSSLPAVSASPSIGLSVRETAAFTVGMIAATASTAIATVGVSATGISDTTGSAVIACDVSASDVARVVAPPAALETAAAKSMAGLAISMVAAGEEGSVAADACVESGAFVATPETIGAANAGACGGTLAAAVTAVSVIRPSCSCRAGESVGKVWETIAVGAAAAGVSSKRAASSKAANASPLAGAAGLPSPARGWRVGIRRAAAIDKRCPRLPRPRPGIRARIRKRSATAEPLTFAPKSPWD
jgi:hypothetical protein